MGYKLSYSSIRRGLAGEGVVGASQIPPLLTLSSQGWTWHSPSCYWLGEDQVTYGEARRLCMEHGSQLVTITNRSGGRCCVP